MALRERALRVLRSRAANNVEFSFTGSTGITIEVDRTSFGRVADAIRDGRIVVQTDASLGRGEAEYDMAGTAAASSGTMRVRLLRGREAHGFFIHECVHASFDLTRSVDLPVIDNEAAAYIADAMYYRRTGLGRNRYHNAAWPEAVRFADSYIRTRTQDRGAVIALFNAIMDHPDYSWAGKRGCYADGDG